MDLITYALAKKYTDSSVASAADASIKIGDNGN